MFLVDIKIENLLSGAVKDVEATWLKESVMEDRALHGFISQTNSLHTVISITMPWSGKFQVKNLRS